MLSDDGSSRIFYRNGPGSVETISRGSGAEIVALDGTKYIDAMGGVAVQIIGHGNETVRAAIYDALDGYAYTYSQSFTSPYQEELAQLLNNRLRMPNGARWYFASGGSEANEMAIKFARMFHLREGRSERYKVISMTHSYHGNTMATLGLSDRPSWSRDFHPYLRASPHVGGWKTSRNLSKHGDETSATAASIDDLERIIWSEGADSISAFILEPVSGSSVVAAAHTQGFIEAARSLCDEHEILLIADEVFCGYGRTGLPLAMQRYGVEADITTLGKGLGSGYVALSGCVLMPRVVEGLTARGEPHQQGYTFSGLPLACAAGVAVSDVIERESLFERSAEMGSYLLVRLQERLAGSPVLGDLRGFGMLVGLDLVKNRDTLQPFSRDLEVASKVVDFCHAKGVIVASGSPGTAESAGGDQIHLAPPFVIERSQVDRVVDVLSESLESVAAPLM